MKVLIATTSFPAHREDVQSPFILKFAQSLHHYERLHVDVLCPLPSTSALKEEVLEGIFVHRFQYFYPRQRQILSSGGGIPSMLKKSFLANLQFLLFVLAFLFRAHSYVRRSDVVHAQWSLSAFAVLPWTILYRRPLIVSLRGADVDLALKHPLTKLGLMMVLKFSTYLTPNNKGHYDLLCSLGYSHKVEVVPNGVDTALYRQRPKKTLRKKLGIPQQSIVAIFVGWLIPRKGVEYLLRAFSELYPRYSGLRVYVVGSGYLDSSLKRLAQQLGVADRVTFVGAVPSASVPLWVSASDMLVLPSLSEGRPNVIGEAMAAGLPVLASRIPGNTDLIQEGVSGLFFAPKNSHDLARALKTLARQPALRRRMGKQARSFILSERLSWKDCARHFHSIYRRFIR